MPHTPWLERSLVEHGRLRRAVATGWAAVALVLVTGCADAGSEPSAPELVSATPVSAGPEPVVGSESERTAQTRTSSSRPGQGFEFAVSPTELLLTPAVRGAVHGAVGALPHLSERAIALLVGASEAVDSGLPDPEAALGALETYIAKNKVEAERLGDRLRTIKEARTPRQNERWAEMARIRFAAEIGRYQVALAGFEAVADNGQIVRLNAQMKSFTASMRVAR